MRQYSKNSGKNRVSHWDDHTVCVLSSVIWSGGSVSTLLCRIAKFHSYSHPTAAARPVQINSQMRASLFSHLYTVSPVPCYQWGIWPCVDSLTLLHMADSSTSSTVNVHDPAMAPEVPLCEMFPFLSACCIPTLQWALFHITDLHLQKSSKNYQLLGLLKLRKLLSAQSSAWIKPNYMALSGNAHFSYDNAYLRLINFEELSTLITVIWDSDHKA